MASKNRPNTPNAGVKQLLQGSKEQVQEELIEAALRQPTGFSRIVDIKTPLWTILGGAGTGALLLVTMWFDVQATRASVAEMKGLMREMANSSNLVERELTDVRARQRQSEETIRDMRLRLDNLHTQLNAMAVRPYYQPPTKEQR